MATVRMPSSLQAQITRSAISPRLAIRIFLNISMCGGGTSVPARANVRSLFCSYREQILAVLDGLAVSHETLHHFAGDVGLDFVHQLHGFDYAQHLSDLDRVAGFQERWRTRRW